MRVAITDLRCVLSSSHSTVRFPCLLQCVLSSVRRVLPLLTAMCLFIIAPCGFVDECNMSCRFGAVSFHYRLQCVSLLLCRA